MISNLHLIVLGIVQGITEFLPVSSSAHLILVPQIMGETDQGLMIDVGAHAGTLLAVCLVFWRESLQMLGGLFDTALMRKTWNARLAQYMILASIPGAVAGLAIVDYQETLTRHLPLIIISNIIWAGVLWWADKKCPQEKTITNDLTWKRALFAGFAQVLALVPGTSRSGITITSARFMGFTRLESARLSLLMSIPITAGAVLAVIGKLIKSHPGAEEIHQFLVVAVLSFITALFAIMFLMRWLKRFNFTPFVVYRYCLAAALIVWLYF